MIGPGRPLRFLAMLLGGWIVARLVLGLWPESERVLVDIGAELLASAPATAGTMPKSANTVIARKGWFRKPLPAEARTPESRRAAVDLPMGNRSLHAAVIASPLSLPVPIVRPAALQGAPVGKAPLAAGGRWSAAAWLVARGRGAATLAPGGTLGGSQAGLRIAYRPFDAANLAVFLRASRPLSLPGAEIAAGIDMQPFAGLPVRVALEQRVAIERGAAEGTALSLVGGVSDVPLPGGLRADGYGQAGVIGLRRRAMFADGALTIGRPVAAVAGAELSIGAGVWGAAQPDLSRLDIGPRAELRMPIAGQRVRLGVEWRERIAGNARPNSGPALILGADF